MSEPEIMEAVDTRNELNAEKYAQMATDKEQQEIDISRAMAEMLAEVEEVVDELHAFRHAQSNAIWDLGTELPHSLRVRIWKLSEEGLEELPQEIRQEERLRIVEALGLCLELSEKVTVMDKELIGESELSPAEVEALYRRLESSTALKYVDIDIPANASENWEPESWRLLADILLGAQSLVGVTLEDQPLSGPALSQLAKAVAASGRGPSPVEWVIVEHGLRERSGGTTGSVTAEWAETVANLTVAAPSLKSLHVHIGPFADEDVAELIGEAVVWLPSLKALHIRDVGGDCDSAERESDGGETSVLSASIGDCDSAELESETSVLRASIEKKKMDFVDRLLSRAFLGNPCNTSINCLDVDFDEKGASSMPGRYLQVLCPVLQMNTHIRQLELWGMENLLARDLRDFLKSLPVNGVNLQSLALSQWTPISGRLPKVSGPESLAMGFTPDSFSALVEILKSNSVPGLKHLRLNFDSSNRDTDKALDWPGLFSSLAQMESVSVSGSVGLCQAEREVTEWIQTSQALQKLALLPHVAGDEASKVNWRSIFHCLRENSNITHLVVPGAALDDDGAYRELMEVLQVNSTLQEVDFWMRGSDSSRAAAVREALKGTARQESYLAELQKGLGGGRGKWESPKCGRVFLCGAPEAGKTRLTRSMLKVAQGKSFVKKVVNSLMKKLRRTEGVEIHTLRNDEKMQILVWDLAGQDIFRALQQFLFPRLSRALLFIFVFSPFSESSTGEMTPKCDMEIAFRKELVEWLRFIASNSAVTGCNVPQVMVVISHKDIYQSNDVDVKWSEKILVELIKVFQDVIHILPTRYFINGGDSRHVKLILDDVYSIFDDLFERKLFTVPTACSQLSQHIVQWTSHNPKKPVIEDQTFFSLCGSISDFQTFSNKCHEEENRKVLKATASYLHDVGTIIDMTAKDATKKKQGNPECNLIVVNPNWLTHVFLGSFISFAQGFQQGEGEVQRVKSMDGFLCEADFQHLLLDRFLEPMKNQFPNITLGILQDLMQNLDLLYISEAMNEHNVSQFFIPTLFKTRVDQTLCWHQDTFPESSGLCGDISFLGLRLCCKDSTRTYLSPAFFSRFQVMIWRKWKEDLLLKTSFIECKLNLISILVDGYDILIENDQYGDFIDVLIRSSRSQKAVWEFVEKQIVEELRDFCASSKGSPGVELVMHVIRTECVKRLTLCEHRRSQSVSREDLKRTLMESLEKVSPSSEERDLHLHTWLSVPEANLKPGFENIVELLAPEDVHAAYIWIKGQMQLLQQKVIRLEEVSNLVDDDRKQINILLETNKYERSRSDQWVSPMMRGFYDLRREIQDVNRNVRRVGEDVKVVLAGVQELKVQIQKMSDLQGRELEKVTQMYDKLDQLMGNSMSTTEWPKRPYFTCKDVSVNHKITAVVEIAKPLMLHFECEERDGHHFVPKQPGYQINVEKDNCEALRQISKTSVRVIWYLLKAGLHISTGVEDLVPELQTSDGKTTSLTSLSIARLLHKVPLQDNGITNQTVEACSPEKAWRYLQDFLRSNLTNKITEHFLLHLAQYLDSKSTYAWLCQECIEKGLERNKLKKL